MQKAAGTLYTVAKVLNIIGIVFMALFALVSFYGISNAQKIFDQMQADGSLPPEITSPEAISAVFTTLLIVMVVALVFSILLLVFGGKAKKALGNGESKYQIIVLVLSILGGGIFYLIASILGLVLANKKPTEQPEQQNIEQQ